MKPNTPHALLFDLDGTLLDTAPEFVHCLNLLLQKASLPLITLEKLRPMVSQGSLAMVACAFAKESSPFTLETLKKQFLELYAHEIGFCTALFPNITEVITSLDARHVPWGIVTNKHTSFTRALIKKFPLLHSAGCIVCGDTLAESKPHPAPLQHACKILNVSPKACWYVGDAHTDVLASQAAKMPCALAQYGYVPPHQNLLAWGADYYLHSPIQILELVK